MHQVVGDESMDEYVDLTSDKNFEMSRIHFSWFVLYGGDDGAGGFDEEKLERKT